MALDSQKNDQNLVNIIKKATDGDEMAFGQVYDLYFDKLYRFVFYRVSHKETAEDLVSDTFIKAWEKIHQIDDLESFNGWIFQIARNLVIDYYRAKKQLISLDGLENTLEFEDNIIETTELGLKQQKLLTVLRQLPSDQQLVIKFKVFDKLTNKEISIILKKSEGSIRVIQHRAIKELKNHIQQDQDNA